jgi:hypothetical protein
LKKRLALALVLGMSACYRPPLVIAPAPATIAVTPVAALDTAPKAPSRLVPPETWLRTYLMLFGGGSPMEVQRRAKGNDNGQEFDDWNVYLAALGFPDYRLDLPRATQTNALMIAAFERLGDTLCDRMLEHDLKSTPPVPIAQRTVFAFDLPSTMLDIKAFAPRFDVLHRTFLGYPMALGPANRVDQFHALYKDTFERHAKQPKRFRFTPAEAGWAAVCYALVRHPEFHFY